MKTINLKLALSVLIAISTAAAPAIAAGPVSSLKGGPVTIAGAGSAFASQPGLKNPEDLVGLNPQPLPPKTLKRIVRIRFGSEVMLNPQPLPPKQVSF